MIAGNLSAAMSNLIPFTQSLATTDHVSALKGIFTSTMTPFNKHLFKIDGIESDFFTRRYPMQRINVNFVQKAETAMGQLFQGIDQFSVKAILAGKYYEGRSKGLEPEQAMKEAGDYTGKLVTDRSWGQLPVLMEAKGLRIFTRFQTEVNNMISFLQQDVPAQYHGDVLKIVNSLAQFSIYSWVFNNLYEEVTGRRPTIDPIYMLATLAGINKSGENRAFTERIFPATKEMAGSFPFGNLVMDGGRFPISAGVPNFWNVAKNPDLGTMGKEISKPLFYLAPPFGGGQLKKTLEGTLEFVKGRSETPAGEERYGIHHDFRNFMQGFLFGQSAFSESVKYWSLPKDER
jgi:hypothetical protein